MRELITELLATDPQRLTLRDARGFAQRAYSGWQGWHHSWHWKPGLSDQEGFLQLHTQARDQVAEMDKEITALIQRKSATVELIAVLDAALTHTARR